MADRNLRTVLEASLRDIRSRREGAGYVVTGVPEPVRVPGTCLVCGGEMQASGIAEEHPTTGRTMLYECVTGDTTEHRRVIA